MSAPKRQPVFCQMADAVAAGAISSSKTEAEWRALCPGSTLGSSGEVCPACDACPRAGEKPRDPMDRCEVCWDWDPGEPKELLLGMPRCIDFDACHTRYTDNYQGNEVFRREVDKRVAERPAKASGAVVPEPMVEGRCEHCGRLTRGARFLPGHDLELRAALTALATAGEPARAALEATMELSMRGWLEAADRGAIPGNVLRLAEKALAKDGAEDWFDRRIYVRMKACAARLGPDIDPKQYLTPTPKNVTPEVIDWSQLDNWTPKKKGRKK